MHLFEEISQPGAREAESLISRQHSLLSLKALHFAKAAPLRQKVISRRQPVSSTRSLAYTCVFPNKLNIPGFG